MNLVESVQLDYGVYISSLSNIVIKTSRPKQLREGKACFETTGTKGKESITEKGIVAAARHGGRDS